VTVNSRIALSALAGGGPEPVPAPQSRPATWALWLGLAGVGLGFMLMFMVLTPAAIAPFLWVGLFVGLLVDGVL
jgi:Na+-transporting NADH:ubiquinone oxidoreductase subunit NqrB